MFIEMIANLVTLFMGNKNLATATRTRDWMVFCLVYLFTVSGVVILVTTTAIEYFILGIFQQTFSATLGSIQHHCRPQESSALGTRTGWGIFQSRRPLYTKC